MHKRKNRRLAIWLFGGLLVALAGVSVVGLVQGLRTPPRTTAVAVVAQPLSHERFEEVSAKLTELTIAQEPSASFDYLRTSMATDLSVAHDCHMLLHHLGHEAYKKYGSFSAAIAYQDGLCNSGYTHGAVEAQFLATDDVHGTLLATCAQAGERTFAAWQCYHGTGHGLMYVTGKDLNKSVLQCQEHTTDFARKSCVNGAFMEKFVVVSHTGMQSNAASTIDANLCKAQDAAYKTDCYFYAPTAYLTRSPGAYDGAFRECRGVEDDYQRVCVSGVGSQAMKDNVTKPELAVQVCQSAPRRLVVSCVQGAVQILVNHYASTEPVTPLCSTAFKDYKPVCLQVLANKRADFLQFE